MVLPNACLWKDPGLFDYRDRRGLRKPDFGYRRVAEPKPKPARRLFEVSLAERCFGYGGFSVSMKSERSYELPSEWALPIANASMNQIAPATAHDEVKHCLAVLDCATCQPNQPSGIANSTMPINSVRSLN